MAFHRERVIELVTDFYRSIGADEGTRFLVVQNLDEAVNLAVHTTADERVADIAVALGSTSVQELDDDRRELRNVHTVLFRQAVERTESVLRMWLKVPVIVTDQGTRSAALAQAYRHGLGWLIPTRRTAIIVPLPVVRVAEGQPDVLHDDTGRMAVVWPDGHGHYYLHGSEFDKRRYVQIINHDLLIQDIAALDNADQRAIALQYLTFEQLVLDSDAQLIDRGVRGTRLYRLELPPRIARDRKKNYGGYDYFIHMRDASHPEREFIEWVDPRIGCQRDAELCQAHAFGISLDEWLSIEHEG